MQQRYVLALDQGTSSSRAVIFDRDLRQVALANRSLSIQHPAPGWVEQDPMEIWQSIQASMQECLEQAGLKLAQIEAIGITNQRETLIAWDRFTGLPLAPAIVWQCRRSAAICQALKDEGWQARVQERTGLVLDPYFSASKMRWLLDHNQAVKEANQKGSLVLGTVDAWLIYHLTGKRVLATDSTNASRTLLFDLHQLDWEPEMCDLFGIAPEVLPEVKPSSSYFGLTDPSLGAEVPIAGVAGDQQAALFGQACFEPGMGKATYGTGCFLLINSGDQTPLSAAGLLNTLAWQIGDQATYALEGSVFVAGALLQWMRDRLGLFDHVAQTQGMAQSLADNGGVYVVPALVGLGAPHWDTKAKGLIIGLGPESGREHLVRAGLEAIAYQTQELLEAAAADLGHDLRQLRVDGGGAANDFLCQFQADLGGLKVSRPAILESTALGAATLAGLTVGVWKDLPELTRRWKEAKAFHPHHLGENRLKWWAGWQKAVARSKDWLP